MLRTYGADIDRDTVPLRHAVFQVGKAGEVGCQFHKGSVFPDGADNALHGFAGRKVAGIFHPGTQQFPVRHGEPAILTVDGQHRSQNFLTGAEAHRRMGKAGDGNALDGQHGDDSAADIHERAKGLHVGDPAGEEHPRFQCLQQVFQSFFLHGPAGEQGMWRALFVGGEACDCKADWLANQRQQRDVPAGPADPGRDRLLPGNQPLHGVQ
ncbi:hypothetical protein SDC9_147300 [bioreactor metagenome]|uniref:Uncharacterized protein n=1 Tax=bioreactor metagenome TaxID=1076179 RepID=A0A645EFB7_9ZZZZ